MKSESKIPTTARVVASTAELQAAGRLVVEFEGKRWVLFWNGGQVKCIADRCPHAGGALSEGDCDGHVVRCPRHGWRFALESGQCLSNPRFEVATRRLYVKEEAIWVVTEEAAGEGGPRT